jgi:formamidopyrimidine-DNA glycosylase
MGYKYTVPELPDVEGFRRYLARHAEGHRIEHVDAPDRQLLRNRSPQAFERALRGERFERPRRHGKWLIAPVGGVEVLLHFGMTGLLRWTAPEQPRDRHDRVIFVCDGGELRYNNMRRFGGVWLARDEDERVAVTGRLGPDAAALDRERFEELLAGRRGAVKAALMDQRLIAGIGNLLSDEILWRACIHPSTPVATLDRRRRDRLYEALRAAVGESIRHGRIPRGERWLTRVRDDREARCPRCGTRLRRATIAGRTACWCPRCQRLPRTSRRQAVVRRTATNPARRV